MVIISPPYSHEAAYFPLPVIIGTFWPRRTQFAAGILRYGVVTHFMTRCEILILKPSKGDVHNAPAQVVTRERLVLVWASGLSELLLLFTYQWPLIRRRASIVSSLSLTRRSILPARPKRDQRPTTAPPSHHRDLPAGLFALSGHDLFATSNGLIHHVPWRWVIGLPLLPPARRLAGNRRLLNQSTTRAF